MVFLVALGASSQRATSDDGTSRPDSPADATERLSDGMVQFSTAVTQALGGDEASNSYSHQTFLRPKNPFGVPHIELDSTDARASFASTDCSGWLSFALNTVSPLHEAVLQSQRKLPEYNRAYSEDFALRESRRPWARAFVVTQYLRDDHAEATGFEPVTDFERLQPGDIGAYAMGRYTKPSDDSRPKPKDTGHVFIVVGPPTVVDPKTEDHDGRGTLSEDATKVIAVPVIDSSSIVHFDADSRKTENGRYALPEAVPHSRARPGGVGTGTIWFALSDEGRVLQRRLGPGQKYRPVLARAARLIGRISLDETILDDEGDLELRVFEDSPSELDGLRYGEVPVNLTGEGGLRVMGGRLVLNGHNDFAGGVTVESGDLTVGSSTALGAGDVAIRGGTITLQQPAMAVSASVTLADDSPEGSVRLGFEGSNVVRSLRIGDTTHLCGTWGGPESGAMFVDPVFSGPGILELAAEPLEACSPTSEGTPEATLEAAPEGTPEGTPEGAPEGTPVGAPETTSEGSAEQH